MDIDRKAFLASLGPAEAVAAMSPEERAEALEKFMIAQLAAPAPGHPQVRRGTGVAFGGPTPSGVQPELPALEPMPERPTLVDFFRLRFVTNTVTHMTQSANDALKKGQPEEVVFACLLHDIAVNLIKVDHGWWGAQMIEPYVSEKVSWAIRHHQALRFYADTSVGYDYPDQYVRIFGADYQPAPYIKATYDYARNHRWYMEARMITVHDLYAFDPNLKVPLDRFIDIIGRHFRQPKEGLGYDGSPVAHMWRSLINPEMPL